MYLDKNLGILHVKQKNSKELMNNLIDILEENNIVKGSFRNAILEREDNYPTGLEINGYGFAIPHTDGAHVNKSQICYATLVEPVEFRSMTDPNQIINIQMVFMITMKEAHEQLEMLQNLMSLFQNKNEVHDLLRIEDKEIFKNKLISLGIQ